MTAYDWAHSLTDEAPLCLLPWRRRPHRSRLNGAIRDQRPKLSAKKPGSILPSLIARHLTACPYRLLGQHNANLDRARQPPQIAPAFVASKKLGPLFAPNRSGA